MKRESVFKEIETNNEGKPKKNNLFRVQELLNTSLQKRAIISKNIKNNHKSQKAPFK